MYKRQSLTIAVTATVGKMFVSSMVAYGFAKTNFKGKSACFMIVLSTMMIPSQVTLIPLFIIFRQFGWINTYYPLIVPSLFGKMCIRDSFHHDISSMCMIFRQIANLWKIILGNCRRPI